MARRLPKAVARMAVALWALGAVAAERALAADLTPVSGGTLVVAVATELVTLNPGISSGSGEGVVGCMMLEGLVEIDGQGNPVPDLAKSWTVSDDGKTYAFELADAKWHDGTPFTSKDVAYSFQNVNGKYAPLFSAQLGKRIATIETPDERHVVIRLTEPFGPLLRMLTCWNGGAIVPEHVFAGTDPTKNPASAAPIGTGPFRFGEWRTGSEIRLTRNPDYRKPGRPYLDGIVVRFMPNAASRVQAMLAGEVDFIQKYYLPVSDIRTVANSRSLKLEPASQAPNVLLGFFNVKTKPFDDKRVRQVLFSLVDRNFIRQAAFSGQGEPGKAPFPKGIAWAADSGIDYDRMYPVNVAAANAALDEIGLKRDASGTRFKTILGFEASIPERLNAATVIKTAWRQVGVDVELTSLEPAVLLPRAFTDYSFGVTMHSYGSYGDPALGLARAFIGATIGRTYGNGSQYDNPQVNRLFEEGASLADPKARGDLYRQVQRVLADELPVMTLHENRGVDGASAKLNGVWGYEGAGRFGEAWLSR